MSFSRTPGDPSMVPIQSSAAARSKVLSSIVSHFSLYRNLPELLPRRRQRRTESKVGGRNVAGVRDGHVRKITATTLFRDNHLALHQPTGAPGLRTFGRSPPLVTL